MPLRTVLSPGCTQSLFQATVFHLTNSSWCRSFPRPWIASIWGSGRAGAYTLSMYTDLHCYMVMLVLFYYFLTTSMTLQSSSTQLMGLAVPQTVYFHCVNQPCISFVISLISSFGRSFGSFQKSGCPKHVVLAEDVTSVSTPFPN